MQRLLIILGLVIIPFYEIFLKILPFVATVAPDSRCTKEILAMIFALSIGLLAVFNGEMKSFRNKWLLFIPVYFLFNLIMAPHFDLFVNNVESGDMYFWKPFSEVLCFSLMIIAISSIELDFEKILKVMVICGTVMAGYVILQKLGLDQFWVAREQQNFTAVRGHELGGNLGQPTIVASWIVMMVPLAFYLKKYWMVILMIIACLLTQGAMVLISLIFISLIALGRYLHIELLVPRKFIISLFILIGIVCVGFGFYNKNKIINRIINRMDGRYEVWKNTIEDIHNGHIDNIHKYPITGVGLGRFVYIFPSKHKSVFAQTHNDPLEFIYNCGLLGAFILFFGIFVMIRDIQFNSMSFSILLSFIAILFCSLGSFPFQLGAHQFYSALLVGLLNNDLIRRI